MKRMDTTSTSLILVVSNDVNIPMTQLPYHRMFRYNLRFLKQKVTFFVEDKMSNNYLA